MRRVDQIMKSWRNNARLNGATNQSGARAVARERDYESGREWCVADFNPSVKPVYTGKVIVRKRNRN